jgi:hypothetical protein
MWVSIGLLFDPFAIVVPFVDEVAPGTTPVFVPVRGALVLNARYAALSTGSGDGDDYLRPPLLRPALLRPVSLGIGGAAGLDPLANRAPPIWF